jgi:hypothetical protein
VVSLLAIETESLIPVAALYYSMSAPELPESCQNDNHDFGQGGRCRDCGIDRADTVAGSRRTGGAGARTNPTTDREYGQQIRKLERRSDEEEDPECRRK